VTIATPPIPQHHRDHVQRASNAPELHGYSIGDEETYIQNLEVTFTRGGNIVMAVRRQEASAQYAPERTASH